MILWKKFGRTLRKKAFFSSKATVGRNRITAAKTSETRAMDSLARFLILEVPFQSFSETQL